ncbi:glycosyltransferase family 4 protein [Chitinophaga polysaccharea]|uniref:glycosyltransferase family 4 protein n=1 Tax=Chitinophaga polysaccharea TaxID=1293035 RepID=UPI0011571173|nr:glycosyltransferase family 4 protein [Chitinophaga polysaccharea]
MRVTQINTYDKDGGAAKAAVRLNTGLKKIGIDSHLVVQISSGEGTTITPPTYTNKLKALVRPHIDRYPLRRYSGRSSYFSVNWLNNGAIHSVKGDILNLHWVNDGFISLKNIQTLEKPVIWTLHDSWAFTGGCHLPYDCERYQSGCGQCPLLKSLDPNDITKRIWNRKKKVYDQQQKIVIVTPSKWLFDKARESALLQHYRTEHIPNGVNTSVFKPFPKEIAREILNLPVNKKIILFGASGATADPNKGYAYFEEVAIELKRNHKDFQLVVFGGDKPEGNDNFNADIIFLGKVVDEITLSVIYNAADIFVSTSKSENLPNTIMEAMSCGVPCVAFNVGGIGDLIKPGLTGALIKPFEIKEMIQSIILLTSDSVRYAEYAGNCRDEIVNTFEIIKVATRYQQLYNAILTK